MAKEHIDPAAEPTVEQPAIGHRVQRPREALRVGPWIAGSPEPTGLPGSPADDGPGAPTDAPAPAGSLAIAPDGRAVTHGDALSGKDPASLTDPLDGLRMWARQYGWLPAVGGVAAVVLLCSAPFVSGHGLLWNPAPPADSAPAWPIRPTPAADTPTPDSRSTADPTPLTRSAAPQAPLPRPTAARPRSTPAGADPTGPAQPPVQPPVQPSAEPMLLGPADGEELSAILDGYCGDRYGRWSTASLRDWQGPAENNWECRRRGDDPLIDVTEACVDRYGAGTFARPSNSADPWSWRCYRR